MSYCKYCQNILKIVKNKEYNELVVQELLKEDLVNLLSKKLDAISGQYIQDETIYRINFTIDEIDKMDINMKKFKGINIDELKTELKNLYEEIIRGNSNGNMFNFLCTNCSMTYYLQPGTVIDSVSFMETNYVQDETPEIRFDDPTLFRTKDFICVNNKCITNNIIYSDSEDEDENAIHKIII